MASALARGIGEPRARARPRRGPGERARRELGGEAVASNAELAERADVVVLCHKPAQLEEVAGQVEGRASAVASILAATPTDRIEAAYPDLPVYRFIPNIPAEVRQGVLCYAPGSLRRGGARGGAARALRPRRGRDPARRGADRARDGPHELRPRLHVAGGRVLRRRRRRARAGARGRAPHDGGDDGRHRRLARAPRLRPRGPSRTGGHAWRRHGARPPCGSRPRGCGTSCRAAVDAVVEGTR